MKNILISVAALTLFCAVCCPLSTARAQGTAFTYQGRLNDGANLANGSYDLRFIIYDNSAGGSQQGPILTNSAAAVSNGLFTVTLNFGNQFPGANRWLEIAVRTNGNGSFFTLSPRQPLTPAPYAITAGNVVSNGIGGTYGNTVTFNNANNSFSGAFTGNGANMTNVSAAKLGGLPVSSFWQTSGNGGTVPGANVLGTTDNQPLELWVNGARALKIIPTTNTANLIGGSLLNVFDAGVVGATIAGGGTAGYQGSSRINYVRGNYGSIGGGIGNTASNIFTTVAGGLGNMASGVGASVGGGGFNGVEMISNVASGDGSTVGGGVGNSSSRFSATVGGGLANTAGGIASTIGGGGNNTAGGFDATIGGGDLNSASGADATIPGGYDCTAAGDYSFAAGRQAKANHQGAFVWADSVSSDFASTGNDQFLIRASGGVGIGLNNPAGQLHVASASGNPQVQITQNTTSDYMRLRMNVLGSPSWEMDVSPGATPALSWWNVSQRMVLDFNGNLTTSGTVNGTSDRNAKEKFTAVSSRAVLDKVAALPISEWNFKNESTIRHIGPMAQDFYAAFSVGMDDKHIATVDEGGVALAAIQGLNQKLEDRSRTLEMENAKLKQRLDALEKKIRN